MSNARGLKMYPKNVPELHGHGLIGGTHINACGGNFFRTDLGALAFLL